MLCGALQMYLQWFYWDEQIDKSYCVELSRGACSIEANLGLSFLSYHTISLESWVSVYASKGLWCDYLLMVVPGRRVCRTSQSSSRVRLTAQQSTQVLGSVHAETVESMSLYKYHFELNICIAFRCH